MKIHTKSKNEYVREEYNLIRKNLVQLLRTINAIAKADNEMEKESLLVEAKNHSEKNDVFANGSLDNLIRQELIPNEIATSLMNDSAYAYDISQNLIAVAEVLFINRQMKSENSHEYSVIDKQEIV